MSVMTNLLGSRPYIGAGMRRLGGASPMALAIAIGLGAVSAATGAFAQQAQPSSSAGAASGIIRLADNSAAAKASGEAADPPATLAAAAPTPADNPYAHLGGNPLVRLWNYEKLELGMSSAPVDPTASPAPPSIRAGWPAPPQTTPPMPFTDWPYGGSTMIGDNRTASIDSPLMVAIANTSVGKWMNATGIQAYGWIDYGGNLSSSKLKGGNAPAAYDYQPNNIQLDQAVIYVERTPDTVQTDHIDWGFRLSGIYGENYRYTTSYGIASYQLLDHNAGVGYDFPMVYGELWIPQVAQGLMIRVGRYIAVPDIEAQLAPNNYMYTHSITYTLDNYTNEGIHTSLAITKQIILQLGLTDGTEAAIWHKDVKVTNFFADTPANLTTANNYLAANGLPPVTVANPLYGGSKFLKDPGVQPSGTFCARYQSLSGRNDINLCANGINKGNWGYNNLQWYGATFYHTFDKHWHISMESYEEHQDGVPNIKNPLVANVIYPNGGTPFSPQYIPFNAPYLAHCKSVAVYRCQADSIGAVFYLNYSPNALNNISFRGEYYDDPQGQRTGYAAVYYEGGIGWQHWLSPQIEMRPEFTYYHASTYVFNDGTKNDEKVFSGDLIVHF